MLTSPKRLALWPYTALLSMINRLGLDSPLTLGATRGNFLTNENFHEIELHLFAVFGTCFRGLWLHFLVLAWSIC